MRLLRSCCGLLAVCASASTLAQATPTPTASAPRGPIQLPAGYIGVPTIRPTPQPKPPVQAASAPVRSAEIRKMCEEYEATTKERHPACK